jgi:hypothetical protein
MDLDKKVKEDTNEILSNVAFEFEVTWKETKGFFRKKTEIKTKKFTITPPTLGVLDVIAEITKGFKAEQNISPNNILSQTRKLITLHAKSMAKAVAAAVLGEAIFKRKGVKISVLWQDIESLANLFYQTLTPSQLAVICDKITGKSGFADFINSMRIMATAD